MKIVETKSDYLLSYIIRRVAERNQNFLACYTGQTGSGKTYGALTLCEMIAQATKTKFTADNVVFSAEELMNLIEEGELKKGSCILFDEAGVGYNNRDWQSVGNKMLNFLMQTFRHRNYVVIFTMPDFGFVDKAARKLFHARFETIRINYSRSVLYCKPLFLEVNQSSGKQYNKYFRIPVPGKITHGKIMRALFRLPSKGLVEAYEAKKKMFTDELNKDIRASLAQQRQEQEKELGKLTPKQNYIKIRTLKGDEPKTIAADLQMRVEHVKRDIKILQMRGQLGGLTTIMK